jgi:hypothetical protein
MYAVQEEFMSWMNFEAVQEEFFFDFMNFENGTDRLFLNVAITVRCVTPQKSEDLKNN